MVTGASIRDFAAWTKPAGRLKRGRRCVEIRFPEELFKAIQDEAHQRQWTFSHMVRHLCEASIEGIE